MNPHLVAVEDIGELVRSQLSVSTDVRAGPAHSHLTYGHRFKLKVPPPRGDGIRLLGPEDTHFVPTGVFKAMAS